MPFNVFHHNVRQAFIVADLIRAHNVFVGEFHDGAGFPGEPAQKLRIVLKFALEHFDGDRLSIGHVDRFIDLCHASGADFFQDSIFTIENDADHCASSAF